MRCFVCVLLLCFAVPALGEEVKFDFRGGKFDADQLRFSCSTPDKFLTPEKQGLRVRNGGVGAAVGASPPGVSWRFHARGNFVTTARYEIIHAEAKANKSSVGPEIYCMFNDPKREGLSFSRLTLPQGPLISFNYMTNRDNGQRYAKDPKRLPTNEQSSKGRLRLERIGATAIASLAEGDDGEFKEIQRTEVGNADVRVVRVAGLAAQDANAVLDLRIVEFDLKADELGYDGKFNQPAPVAKVAAGEAAEKAVAPEPAVAEAQGKPRWSLLIAGVLLAATVLLLVTIGLLVFWLRRSNVKAKPAAKTAHATETEIKKTK